MLSLQSFLRKGVSLGYVGQNQNLKSAYVGSLKNLIDIKDPSDLNLNSSFYDLTEHPLLFWILGLVCFGINKLKVFPPRICQKMKSVHILRNRSQIFGEGRDNLPDNVPTFCVFPGRRIQKINRSTCLVVFFLLLFQSWPRDE